ncbi:MAG: DmsC/YnfH family molybdoenzyme membrane anchor subunit [Puniceicoccaceae bacterium]
MNPNFIEDLLAEQRVLTPVVRFSEEHDREGNALEGTYRDLIPLSAPRPGEQYAFEVDLDRCTGCKACVAACHSLNGLEDNESWREVGRLTGMGNGPAIVQTVTTACHHCEDPGCANGCPVLAYEKDPLTGIVRHLDDQCIGCQYCIMKCPYEVPKYSKRLGIVRKCDMCHDRLAEGEAPACVQACPTSAIAIRVVSTAETKARAEAGVFLPDSPDPLITLPTTRYVSAQPLPDTLRAADHSFPTVQPGHTPLVFMLVFTQAGVGLLLASLAQRDPGPWLLAASLFTVVGLNASVLHLGQPLKAWRAFLGWRKSWLSREIIALGMFGGALVSATGLVLIDRHLPAWSGLLPASLVDLVLAGAACTGLLGVLCSAWVYHDTRRRVWRGFRSFGRFFWSTSLFAIYPALPFLLGAKLCWEAWLSRPYPHGLKQRISEDLKRSSQLQWGPLRRWTIARFALGCLSIAVFFISIPVALGLALVGELVERSLFFRAGVATRMPGS